MSADIPFPDYLEQKRQLTQWKKDNSYLQEVYSQTTQDVVKRMHNTWEAFRRRGYGFPRYKKYGQYKSFYFPQFKDNPISNGTIKLPKLGTIKLKQHRPIPDGFKVKGVRVVSKARGTFWYVVITIQVDVNVPDSLPHGRAIGVDIGLENFLTTSDNFEVKPARFFSCLQSELKLLQRRTSRKKKRSNNYHKAQVKVARLHHKIANTRKDFHFKTAHKLCDQAGMVFLEDIDFTKTAKAMLGKHMLDGAFGQFRQLLKWVGWKRDVYVAEVDHRYTSQICPNCGCYTGKKDLSVREHSCPECGFTTTRDKASAFVIKQRGEASIEELRAVERRKVNPYQGHPQAQAFEAGVPDDSVVPVDSGERKLSAECVLPGLVLGKCNAETSYREVGSLRLYS